MADTSPLASPIGCTGDVIARPCYPKPLAERLDFSARKLAEIEQYIAPESTVMASLLIRALLARNCTTAEAMWAVFNQIEIGRYKATSLSKLPNSISYIVSEHDRPAGLAVADGVLHIDGEAGIWGMWVVTLPKLSPVIAEKHVEIDPTPTLREQPAGPPDEKVHRMLKAALHRLVVSPNIPSSQEFFDVGTKLNEAGLRHLIQQVSAAHYYGSLTKGILESCCRTREVDKEHLAELLKEVEQKNCWPILKGEFVKFAKIVSAELDARAPSPFEALCHQAEEILNRANDVYVNGPDRAAKQNREATEHLAKEFDGFRDSVHAGATEALKAAESTGFAGAEADRRIGDLVALCNELLKWSWRWRGQGAYLKKTESEDDDEYLERTSEVQTSRPEIREIQELSRAINIAKGEVLRIGVVKSGGTEDSAAATLPRDKPDTSTVPTISESPTGFLGGAELADALGVHLTRRDAFFRQLERKRTSLGDDCWHEVHDPRPNSPRFLYRANSPTMLNLATAYKNPKPA